MMFFRKKSCSVWGFRLWHSAMHMLSVMWHDSSRSVRRDLFLATDSQKNGKAPSRLPFCERQSSCRLDSSRAWPTAFIVLSSSWQFLRCKDRRDFDRFRKVTICLWTLRIENSDKVPSVRLFPSSFSVWRSVLPYISAAKNFCNPFNVSPL